MGIGPAYAIPAVVRKAGLTLEDIDVYEINEAFASQVVFCVRFLGLREERVNPQGGAIALGHPLGCSGTRLLVTAAHYLHARNLRYAVVTMCVGTGMGAAALIENPAYNPHCVKQHARARL
jgi:acetyl-CoA acyltransferase 1